MKIYTKENAGELLHDLGDYYDSHDQLPVLQHNASGNGDFIDCDNDDLEEILGTFDLGYNIRFKPKKPVKKMLVINAEVPAPMDEMPEVGSEFWHITTDISVMKRIFKGENDYQSLTLFRVGNCFYGKDDAYAYRDAVFPRLKEGE